MVQIVKIPADSSLPLAEETIEITRGDAIPSYLESSNGDVVIDTSVLIRHSKETTGLYAYSISSTSMFMSDVPNIRATTLAMACGLHSRRYMNDIYIGRLGYTSFGLANVDVSIKDLHAAVHTPDLRTSFIKEISQYCDSNSDLEAAPDWLCAGAQRNYHDNKSMAALAAVMRRANAEEDSESASTSETEDSSAELVISNETNQNIQALKHEVTLCLHCRRPASTLCTCGGAYFCDDSRRCKEIGWSHQCLCRTWKAYVEHRSLLSADFPFEWHLSLLREDCFNSDEAYSQYLMNDIKVINQDQSVNTPASVPTNWWTTEIHGWNGGKSASAKVVDLFRRVSYQDGFGLDASLIPDEKPVSTDDIQRAAISRDENDLPVLTSWDDYYNLRRLRPSSPVALLATFPLTVYYAIQHHGFVPVTVSQMLSRPMRLHLVGIEKELNFIDFFREVGFILPGNVEVEMTWIIRDDMFPEASNIRKGDISTLLPIQLTGNLKLSIIGGTYGEDIDPNFDIAGGTPDMIIGLNAGLYAYESWRHVVSYLDCNPNVVGVFTDYNEHSGMNCASLGGSKARQSLDMNPFRQPRAMPVNCMNLPQFSNGFMYVFNEQKMD